MVKLNHHIRHHRQLPLTPLPEKRRIRRRQRAPDGLPETAYGVRPVVDSKPFLRAVNFKRRADQDAQPTEFPMDQRGGGAGVHENVPDVVEEEIDFAPVVVIVAPETINPLQLVAHTGHHAPEHAPRDRDSYLLNAEVFSTVDGLEHGVDHVEHHEARAWLDGVGGEGRVNEIVHTPYVI